MKAIVVTDQAAGTAGVKLVERPEPQAAINDVVVQIHASGFTGDELTWPSTWTDRVGRDRTPSIPGNELAGVVTAPGYGTNGAVDWTAGIRPHGLVSRRHAGGVCGRRGTQPHTAAGRRRLQRGRGPRDAGPDRMAGAVRARPPSRGAERPRARCGRRSRFDGEPARTWGRRVCHRHRARCRPSDGSRLRRTGVRRPR